MVRLTEAEKKAKRNARNRAYYAKHRKECLACDKEYNDTHREQRREYRKTYRGRKRELHLLQKYNLTLDGYAALVEKQQGKCAICRRELKVLCVDHDHQTDRIRGLLCHGCNRAIGLLNDDPNLLDRIVEYLNVHE